MKHWKKSPWSWVSSLEWFFWFWSSSLSCRLLQQVLGRHWVVRESSFAFLKHEFYDVLGLSWCVFYLAGKPPVVIARGGFSGVFPDSSNSAYDLAKTTTSPDITLWCDLQLTKDGVGICFPNLNLDNGSNVQYIYPYNKEWFSADFTWKQLSNVSCKWFSSILFLWALFLLDEMFNLLEWKLYKIFQFSVLW